MISSGFSVALINFGFLTYFLFDLLGLYSITIKLENILLIIQKVTYDYYIKCDFLNNNLHRSNGYILTFLASRIDLLLFLANSSMSIGRISSTASSAISLIALATFKVKRFTSLSGSFG